jgi:hypothetical protein
MLDSPRRAAPPLPSADDAEVHALPTDYTPRGFLLTADAVDRLFAARLPDLASSTPERETEILRLRVLKRAATRPLPIEPLDSPGSGSAERMRPEFTKVDAERLSHLATIEAESRSWREVAANDIRLALAEGDLAAIMLTEDGREEPIRLTTWRAQGGLDCVKTGWVRMQLPFCTGETEGVAFVKESDLITWLSKHAPKPLSEIGNNNIIVQSSPQPNKTSVITGNKPKVADGAIFAGHSLPKRAAGRRAAKRRRLPRGWQRTFAKGDRLCPHYAT